MRVFKQVGVCYDLLLERSGGIHHNELDPRDHVTLHLYRLIPSRRAGWKYVFQGTAHLVYNENLEVCPTIP